MFVPMCLCVCVCESEGEGEGERFLKSREHCVECVFSFFFSQSVIFPPFVIFSRLLKVRCGCFLFLFFCRRNVKSEEKQKAFLPKGN